MNYKLEEVKEFTNEYLGKKFRLKSGLFVDEEVTVVGYTDKDGLGDPAVIVGLPETPLAGGWGLNELNLEDHVIADVTEEVRLWYAYIENLEEC